MNFFSFATNILEPFSFLIFLLSFAIALRAEKSNEIKALIIGFSISFILMTIASILVFFQYSNIYLYNLNYICLLLTISRFFYSTVKHMVFFIIIVNFLVIFYILLANKNDAFNSINFSLLSLSVIYYCFVYFRNILKEVTKIELNKNYPFWFVCSVFVYFFGCFFIFLTYYYLTTVVRITYTYDERVKLTILWGAHNLLLFFSALISLITSIWTSQKKLI